MTKINKVYCLFEQSGTFKNAFKRAGIDAADYDIKNDFGETDVIIDLFDEIHKAYFGNELKILEDDIVTSIFDEITPDDLIFAFFPCIYFSQLNNFWFCGTSRGYDKLPKSEIVKRVLIRNGRRNMFYEKLLYLCYIAETRNLRLIIENPYNGASYLYNNFPYFPSIIDLDRSAKGDYFRKPTAYYCINFTPTNLKTIDRRHVAKAVCSLTGSHDGAELCNAERSAISPEYAENFINDYILGIRTAKTQNTLFDNL